MTDAERQAKFEGLLTAESYDRAWRYCCRLCMQAGGGSHDAEDLLQEALTRAYLGLHTLRDAKRFGGWLLAIVRRRHHTRLKGRWNDPQLLGERDGAFAAAYDAPDTRTQTALETLARLPAGPRELLALSYLEGLSPTEVATVLGIAPRAVRMRLTRARKMLRDEIGKLDIPAAAEQCSAGRTT
ncbi:MAG: sigma-70 family RNA polymerase sigma factor [bacterium]|nr:sigma-70 family RNA polymerase sigma factor [bacterium]